MPRLDLVAGHSIQCETLTLRIGIASKERLVLVLLLRLLFDVKHFGVLQLLRAEEALLMIRTVLLLVVQIRANDLRVFVLLVFHGLVLELVFGQTLNHIACLRLSPNVELVLLNKVGTNITLPLGRSVLRRRTLLDLNIDVLSRVIVESKFASLSHVAVNQRFGVDVLVICVQDNWLVVVGLILLARLAGGALVLILVLHLLQIDGLYIIAVHRVVRLAPLSEFLEAFLLRVLQTLVASDAQRFVRDYHAQVIFYVVHFRKLLFVLTFTLVQTIVIVVLRCGHGIAASFEIGLHGFADLRRVDLGDLEATADCVEHGGLFARAPVARSCLSSDHVAGAVFVLLAVGRRLAVVRLLDVQLIGQSLLSLPLSGLVCRAAHQLSRARRLRKYRQRVVVLIAHLTASMVRANVLDVHDVRVIRVA